MSSEPHQTRPPAKLFDKVWVLSLPDSHERRSHIARHLPSIGFEHFEFFDATSADDSTVKQALASGEVMQFPPCFRCGGLDCGDPECNNFLIPAQVAVYLSYRRLWRTIVSGTAERVLVVEDDVLFHPHTSRVLSWVAGQATSGLLPFKPGQPCLLRLGWARCEDHLLGETPCRADNTLKMSNPCHALTRDFAAALLARDTGIRHTVDVYQHHLAPRPGEAFTIYPPIASELSWTDGVFASTIHPKPIHAKFLADQGNITGAQAYAQQGAMHVKKKYFRPLLIVGHPCCGTEYAVKLCRQRGLDIGLEKLGADGISSRMLAVEADWNPYALDSVARTRRALAWKYLVMPVRNLASAASSVMHESRHMPLSYDFRRHHILQHLGIDLNTLPNPLEQAIWSITSWARIILSQQPDLCFRIEDQAEHLHTFLFDRGLFATASPAAPLETPHDDPGAAFRNEPEPETSIRAEDWIALQPATQEEITWFCKRFGYPLPWQPLENYPHAQ